MVGRACRRCCCCYCRRTAGSRLPIIPGFVEYNVNGGNKAMQIRCRLAFGYALLCSVPMFLNGATGSTCERIADLLWKILLALKSIYV